jgi:hypothetical protein
MYFGEKLGEGKKVSLFYLCFLHTIESEDQREDENKDRA